MKNEKKFKALNKRVTEIVENSEKLSRQLSMLIVKEAKGNDSHLVALNALAQTVIDVVAAQYNAGYEDAMDVFITMLQAEIQGEIMLNSMREK